MKRIFTLIIVATTLLLILNACQPEPTADQPLEGVEGLECIPASQEPETARVTHIADGDTITVEMNGESYRVRFIGINAPELNSKDNDLAEDAKSLNAQWVEDQTVLLYRDTSETDPYDRLLRYVVVGDTFVNYQLVAQGAARARDYPPDTACSETFYTAQQAAKQNSLGIWDQNY